MSDTPTDLFHDFFFDGQSISDLGTLGSFVDVNDAGRIPVATQLGGKDRHAAFLYDHGKEIGIYGLDADPYVEALNNLDQVVGKAGAHPFIWDPANGMQDLGNLGGMGDNFANALNDVGQVVGGSVAVDHLMHAFIWDPSNGMQDLGDYGYSTQATAINDAGQIVGYFDDLSGHSHAFLYDSGDVLDLGLLPGTAGSLANSINSSGQIVGVSYRADGQNGPPFLYVDGTMYNLNDLLPAGSGWNLYWASKINDQGQILAYGQNPQRQPHACILTPDDGSAPHQGHQIQPQLASAVSHEAHAVTPIPTPSPQRLVGTMPSLSSAEREARGAPPIEEQPALPARILRGVVFNVGISQDCLGCALTIDLLT
jgi:probable HAF family extracellular repeat protein